MYDKEKTTSCLALPVGFRQTIHPDYPQLEAHLTDGKSVHVNDLSPLLSIENIASSAPHFEAFDPATEAAELSKYLRNIIDASALEVAQKVFQQKKLFGQAKNPLENVKLFGGFAAIRDKIVKNNRFVGLGLKVKSAKGLANVIQQIGLQIDTTQAELKLYVYHASSRAPIAVIPAVITDAGGFSWIEAKVKMLDSKLDLFADGWVYVGYYEQDLVGQAIERKKNMAAVPCKCTPQDHNLYNEWSKYYQVHPFSVEEDALEADRTLWDLGANNYTYQTNYGINLQLSAECDLTDVVCRYAEQFAHAVAYQTAEKLLNAIAYNTRNNVVSRETKSLAMHDLNEHAEGIPKKLKKAIEEMHIDLSDLDSPCLPKRNGAKLNYTGI